MVFDLRGGFVFDRSGSRGGFFLHVVERADEEKNHESDNQEVDDGLDEVSVVNGRGFDSGDIGGNHELQGGEVEPTDNHRDNRHDDVVDEGIDD